MHFQSHKYLALSLLGLVMVLTLAGCAESSGSKPPNYAKALRGAPARLANLYSQANELQPGGKEAFDRRLQQLRGFPVVVNLWASWCGNCRVEFPFLQRLSARFGSRIAFFGVDSEDSDDAASTWLKEAPVPYPSITDPDREVADSLDILGFPGTALYDRQGELVYLKQGAFGNEAELETQIHTLLASGS